MTYWPQSTSEEILYIHERNYAQLTVVPVPSNATVTLTATGYTQRPNRNVIKVPPGTTVHYKLVASTYSDVEGNVTVNQSQTVTINMNDYQYDTFTINPTPSDATVTLTASGATQQGNSITVRRGTTINYTVERDGYDTVAGTKVTTLPSESLSVAMQVKTYAFTITPNPADATVTLVSSGGQTQQGNTIRVHYNDNVTWTVSKTGYTTRTSIVTVLNDQTIGVDLTLEDYIITINSTPEDATVTLTSSGGHSQVGKTITVNYNDIVSYSVSATNYQTQTGSLTVTAAQILNINLALVNRTLTISPSPVGSTVTLTAAGYSQVGNSITVPHGTAVSYSVSKDYYGTASGTKIVNNTETMTVTLTELPRYTVTFKAIDEETQEPITNATYTLTSVEGNSSTNSITVHQGTVINYTVEDEEHLTTTGTHTAAATTTVDVNMTGEVTYFAWTNGSDTVYTQSETPNETYGEYTFSVPNELGEPITAHTSNTITANGVTYTRNAASDNYSKVNSFYFTIDTTKYSTEFTTGMAPFKTGSYLPLIGETITIDWGDNSTTTITDGNVTTATNRHIYASAGAYDIRITSTGDFPQINVYFGMNLTYSHMFTKIKSVLPKCRAKGFGIDMDSFDQCFAGCRFLTTIPQNLFKYNPVARSFSSCFSNCRKLSSIPQDLFKYNTEATTFTSCFNYCIALSSVPQDLFKYNIAASTFSTCFYGCAILSSIPQDLFKYNIEATTFASCFYSCAFLTSIPQDLFKYNTEVSDFKYCFNGCTSLTSVPQNLFKYNLAATSFKGCFGGCIKATLSPNIFCNEATEMSTRFASTAPDFSNCFSVSAFTGIQGTAPQLWDYTYTGTPTSSSCFSGQSASSLTNYSQIPSAWGGPA